MRRHLPVLMPIVLLAWTTAQAAAPAVNPLTGQSLAFETAQRRLEQMRLETQLLEEEAKQAAIRNNMSLAPIRRGHEERRLQAEMFGPALAAGGLPPRPGAAGRATGGAPTAPDQRRPSQANTPAPSGSAAPTRPAVAAASAAPMLPAPGPQVLAILRNGDQRRAIVQSGTTTTAVSEGDDWMGRRIDAITDGSVIIDGTPIALPRNPAVIVASDRRPPPGQPVAVQSDRSQPGGMAGRGTAGVAGASAATMPSLPRSPPSPPSPQFLPLPSLPSLPPVPVIGPVDPRNPLSALAPQPARVVPGAGIPAADTLR